MLAEREVIVLIPRHVEGRTRLTDPYMYPGLFGT